MRAPLLIFLLASIFPAACTRPGESDSSRDKGAPAASASPPSTPPAPAHGTAPTATEPSNALACSPLSVAVRTDGVWVGDGKSRRFVPACAAGPDTAAFGAEVCDRARAMAPQCDRGVEMSAQPGVSYQQVVTLMDAVLRVGITDVSLTSPASLALSFPEVADASERATARCGQPVADCALEALARPAPVAPSSSPVEIRIRPAATAQTDLAKAPIIVVDSSGNVSLGGKVVASGKEVAASGERIDKLHESLRVWLSANAPGPAILQADHRIDAAVVNRVLVTIRGAGYEDVLFAVSKAK